MPPRRFRDIDECRNETIDSVEELKGGTDDNDSNVRQSSSTQRYERDVGGYHWPDERGVESAFDATPAEANQLGRALSKQYNGATPRYRWNRIYAAYDSFVSLGLMARTLWSGGTTRNRRSRG